MDKNAIKKYAIWARRELIERVSQRALKYGITAKDTGDPKAESINGHLLSQKEKWQREALIRNIKEKGYEQVMEEVAYTWFNRFAALRFMEVNGYLPSHIRVFTNDAGEFKPQILAEAIHLELDGLDRKKVYELESANKGEELFKYLLIVQCNALNSILPGMFQKIDDYTELLLPDYLLREGSVIEQMVTAIPEEDWTDQVQIIGWLYQYYNTEPKDKVFADLKKNIKITKENIPAATQLFTPDWIVHYMVENSLGRLWLEGHPNDGLKSTWKYYLDEAEQEPEVQQQLAEIRKEYAALKPEEIRVIDPCCGSGHILCVLFDVLVSIYEDYGYTAREAAVKIVENNLWGLDIDERAAQLSYFAVMMKARQYDRRFFTRQVQPHVYAIHETNAIGGSCKLSMGDFLLSKEHQETLNYLLDAFLDAKEYGSILQLEDRDYLGLQEAWKYTSSQTVGNATLAWWYSAVEHEIPHLIDQAIALTQKYHVVVTNPPYMGTKGMNARIASYLKDNYEEAKGDLFAVFISRLKSFSAMHGYYTLVTQRTWLFITAFEKLRNELLRSSTGISFIELGAGAFDDLAGEVVQSVLFCMNKGKISNYTSVYKDLTQFDNKEYAFINTHSKRICIDEFKMLPGYTFAMKLSDASMAAYKTGNRVGAIAQPKKGLISSDNNRFLRLWHEVNINRIQLCLGEMEKQDPCKRWLPHNKGGSFRRWYGNHEYLINWENDGYEVKEYAGKLYGSYSRQIMNEKYYLHESISWSSISSQKIGVRYYPIGFTFDTAGPSLFISNRSTRDYVFGLLGSCVAEHYIKATNPTINLLASDIANLPLLGMDDQKKKDAVATIVESCVELAKEDWDGCESSWNFRKHPLAPLAYEKAEQKDSQWGKYRMESFGKVQWHFENWQQEAEGRFNQLKANEEELNRIFINTYGLQDELTPEVEDKDVTARKADLQRDIRSLISYAVGCMFGRYSLDAPGLILAGQAFQEKFVYASVPVAGTGFCGDPSLGAVRGDCYLRRDKDDLVRCTFAPDGDNIIPICDDEYFEDDIVSRFVKFIEAVYGADSLEDNLKFIADALGGKGTPRQVIRSYFLNDFYTDHLKVYQKRPIYWLFDSGKKNGFKCLIYMHRYQPDTIARIRTDYVHEQQSRYRTAISDLEQRINAASTSERVKLNKQLTKLHDQATELRTYEEKIHHLADQMIPIDLDDGVKHNYEIFKDVLAKIK